MKDTGNTGKLASLALLLALSAGPLSGQTRGSGPGQDRAAESDESALLLAEQAPLESENPRDWQLSMEAALGESSQRYGPRRLQTQRLSLELQIDRKLSKDWRAVLSDQLDQRWQRPVDDRTSINTLKEAYLSWQPQPSRAVDIGRINARYGVASGYNPTDYFRSGANRSIVAIDPASLKRNRQGSVMLRGQTLWNGGSLTAVASPRLGDKPDDAAFSLDVGATNRQDRWLVALSQQLSENLNPQWLLFGEGQQSPQLGFNLTNVWGQATVAYVEWSGGRSESQLAQALRGPDDSAFRSRLATGLSYTSTNKLSLTAEYEFNGGAPSAAAWEALSQRAPLAYLQYRTWVQDKFDLPTRQSVFLYASWRDAMFNHFDLNAMLRWNADDHSRLARLEARHHWEHTDVALQWQRQSGKPGSEFGAWQQQQTVQLLVRYFY